MFTHTGFTQTYMTNFTVQAGDWGLTEMAPKNILGPRTQRVHGQTHTVLIGDDSGK